MAAWNETIKDNQKLKDILGDKLHSKVVKVLDSCCGGISARNGDGSKVLTQKGDFTSITDIDFSELPEYATEIAATSGGLETGRLYKTAAGAVRIKL